MKMTGKEQTFYRIGRARISVTDENRAVESIKGFIISRQAGYICVSTLRTVVIANNDDLYQEVMENSLMNLPDGTPLVWCGHWWGLNEVERACGPHIFPMILKDRDSHLKHFLLGDTEETLSALKKKASEEFGAKIVGTFSPPFKPLEEYDFGGLAKMINDSGATLVWTALRAPKQDFLNARLAPLLNDGIVLIGVGAAFRSAIGELKQPDGLLQKMGLVGLKFKRADSTWWKEFKWYIRHSFYLLKYFFSIKMRRLSGKKYYEF